MQYTLTVYRSDDTTPWFEVGTDPAHPNPYLHEPGEQDAGEVDFLRGRATISQINLRVIDPQTGASQAERWLTERLGIPTGEEGEGHTALIGRRALLMRDGSTVVLDGVVYSVTLSDSFAGFSLSIRDIRERERRSKLFTRTGTASVLPRGVVAGYGRLPSGGWLIPPTTPLRATFRRFTTAVGAAGYFDLSGLWRGNPLSGSRDAVAPASLVVTEAMRRACRSVSSSVEIVPGVILNDIRYPDVQVWWRPAGGGSWTIVSDVLPPVVSPHSLLLNTTQGRLAGTRDTTVEAVYSVGVSTLLGTLPSNGQQVDVMIVYVGPPTEDYPLHIETTAGQLLQDIYDGVYSDEPLGVRYDPAALAALTTPVRLRITEPVEDARRWLEDYFYLALGGAEALDPQGRVAPVRAAFPDPDAVLPVIDDNNAQAIPGWEHRADNAVTVVRVTYPRDYRVPAEQDPTGERSAGDGIASREVIVERRAPEWAIALMGEQVHEIDGSIFRALGGPDGEPVTGDVTDETGAQIALARAHETLDRWVFGGQISSCRIRAADFPGLRVGDWVIDARSWRPNYRTRQRGGQTLAQIMAIRSVDTAWLDVTLVDAGPAEQPVQPPTLGTLSVNDDGVVSVPVTAVPVDGEAAVYYAISATQPAPTSGLWTFLGRLSAPGTLRTPPLPAGVTVWVRARGEALGRRPSQYTTPASIVVTLTPRVSEVRLLVTDHTPTVTWQRNAAAAGVRIYYAVHDPAATPTLSASIDVAATAGAATIPAIAPSGQAVTVEVEPWTGWTGSAVTGTAGPRVRASVAVEPATTPLSLRARVIAQSPSTLTVRVAVADPVDPTRTGDATITYTQSGTGGVTPGSPQVVPAAKIRDTLDASEAAGGYVDFTVTRPAPGAGVGQVAFAAQRLGRTQATATVEVPEQTPTVPDPVNEGPPVATIEVLVSEILFVTVKLNGRRGVAPLEYRVTVGTGDEPTGSYAPLPTDGVILQVKRRTDRTVYVLHQVRDSRGVESAVAIYPVSKLNYRDDNYIRPTRTALPGDEVQRPAGATEWKEHVTLLSDAGLAIGDAVSAGGKFRGAATSATVRFRLQFLTAGDAVISTHDGPAVTPANGQVLESKVEDVTIPAGTAKIRTVAVAVSGSGQPTAFEWQLNPGATLLAYRHPSYQAGRDTLSDITGQITTPQISDNAITAPKIAANAVTAAKIQAGAVEADKIAAGAVTADKLAVGQLSAISADLGDVTAGRVRNATNDAGIALDAGSFNAAWQRYINLAATGSQPFIKHPKLEMRADGEALFSGRVTSGAVVESEFFTAPGVFFNDIDAQNIYADTIRTPALGFGFTEDSVRMGFNSATQRFEWLLRDSGNLTLRFRFDTAGRGEADLGWFTFSPTPPKPAETMTARDWLEWACEDACKPNKPYKGVPHAKHPAIQALAHEQGRNPEDIAEDESERYRKDIAKIAIGAARALHGIWRALEEATTFEEFKAILTGTADRRQKD